MGVQKLIVVIDDRTVEIEFEFTRTLSDLRKTLIDQKTISTDDEKQAWRFVPAGNAETIAETSEQYIPVSGFVYDTNKVRMTNIKRSDPVDLQLFAGLMSQGIKFDIRRKLSDLRSFAIESGYIVDDNDEYAWRFVSPNAKDLKGDVSEAIIGMDGSEKQILVKDFLYGNNKVRMVNIHGKKNPDLIGVDTDYLFDGDIEVTVYRNDLVTPNKFNPIMLKNVKTANKNIKSSFVNVVVCEQGTAIGFGLHTRSHGGMAYSIRPEEGQPICEWITAPSPYCGISWYDGTNDQSIIVDSTANLSIPTRQVVGHRRITVKAWRYISYTRNGKTYIVDDILKQSSDVAMSDEVGVIPGKTIESGATRPGEEFEAEHTGTGGGSSNTDPNEVLGLIEIDFFVFKTREDAERVIESRVNPNYD